MRFATLVTGVSVAATLFTATAAEAVVKTYLMHLDGDQARPVPIVTPGEGNGNIEIDTDARTIKVKMSYHDLTSNEINAHIHGPTSPSDPRGTTAGVLFGLPLGQVKVLTIDYSGHAMPDSVDAWLLTGRTYINIHTVNNPGGEIRGQLDDNQPSPAGSVPAANGWGTILLAFALIGAGAVWMRRQTAAS